MTGCTCAKPGEIDPACIAHGDHPTVCANCLGSGKAWAMQGGPYGIGSRGKCWVCQGTGKPQSGITEDNK
jgi:DnaJ-class molecular chaperone